MFLYQSARTHSCFVSVWAVISHVISPLHFTFSQVGVDAQIMDQIEGVNGGHLPWEGDRLTRGTMQQLKMFQGEVLRLLDRDPLRRPSLRAFHRTCRSVLGDVSTQHD